MTLQPGLHTTCLLSGKDLTLSVLELYRVSGNRKSAEGMMADIATLQL